MTSEPVLRGVVTIGDTNPDMTNPGLTWIYHSAISKSRKIEHP